jgi:hypothetical protein
MRRLRLRRTQTAPSEMEVPPAFVPRWAAEEEGEGEGEDFCLLYKIYSRDRVASSGSRARPPIWGLPLGTVHRNYSGTVPYRTFEVITPTLCG